MSAQIVREWCSPGGFVGSCVFKNAVEACEKNYSHKPDKKENLISHFKKQTEPLANRIDRELVAPDEEPKHEFSHILGKHTTSVAQATNRVYSANNIQPVNLRANLKRQDIGSLSAPSVDQTVNKSYDMSEDSKKFYREVHKINLNELFGADPGGGPRPLDSVVHYGNGYDNAALLPNQNIIIYGDGKIFKPLVEDTVGAHEIGHRVTQELAGTQLNRNRIPTGISYSGDAGGINESNSDANAIALVQKKANKRPNEVDCPWRIGQGLIKGSPNDALRDMANPGNAYKNNKKLGSDPQLGYDNYRNWSKNAGIEDPHLTSAVGNKWYYNAAVAIDAPTWEVIEKIRVAALPLCPPNLKYPEYAQITLKVTDQLFPGNDKIKRAVVQAWQDVGVL